MGTTFSHDSYTSTLYELKGVQLQVEATEIPSRCQASCPGLFQPMTKTACALRNLVRILTFSAASDQ